MLTFWKIRTLLPLLVAIAALVAVAQSRGATGATQWGAPGTIGTLVGHGVGDGAPATNAALRYPTGIAVAANGDLYIAAGCRVRRVAAGAITTVAGNGACENTGDGPALAVESRRLALRSTEVISTFWRATSVASGR